MTSMTTVAVKSGPWMMLMGALLLGGCVSGLKSNQPVTQLYVLQAQVTSVSPRGDSPGATAATGVAATPAPVLEVLRPVASAGLDTDGIALLRSGARLDYYAASRWAAQAPVQLQQLAIDALRASGRFRAVEAGGTPFIADELLRIQVRHFEAVYTDDGAPTIHVTLVCTLGDRTGSHLTGTVTADSHVMATANRMEAVVAAFQSATDDALMQLLDRWPAVQSTG